MALPPVVALEIGTSKIVALVGEMREDGCVMITGMGHHESVGVRKGEIVDLENAAHCVRAALAQAEESGKVTISQIHLSISGGHVQGLVNKGSVPVLDPDHEITQADVEQVMAVAKAVNLPDDREIMHTICQHFCIDDHERVVQPEGMEGSQLSLDMLILHGVRSRINNTIRVVRSVSVEVQDVAFSGLCAALSVLSTEQKKTGVVVIDIGAGTTDYMAYAGNVVAAGGTLGVGGDHITNDIGLAFNIPRVQAEALKRKHGNAVIGVNNDRSVSLPAEAGFSGCTINLKALNTVINARCDEILNMIRKRLIDSKCIQHIGAGVVLTGGVAHLKGIKELTEKIFNMPCSIGRPRNLSGLATATGGPEYAVCSGLVQYAFKTVDPKDKVPSLGNWLRGLFSN